MQAGGFVLTRYLRARGGDRLVVYLEGDARAWRGRDHVTTAPPPVDPLALELATLDPAPSVAWLGRPCQPAPPEAADGCEASLWSDARFSERVVEALDAGLDALRRETGAAQLELVGYSGGGVLAAALAARRRDVVRLVTVAAPLDLAAWLQHHGLSRLDAEDPARVDPARLEGVEQIHLVGAEDRTVPPAIVEHYAAARPGTRVVGVPGRGHGDWAEGWGERIGRLRR